MIIVVIYIISAIAIKSEKNFEALMRFELRSVMLYQLSQNATDAGKGSFVSPNTMYTIK